MSDEPQSSEIQINVKGPNELKLQITIGSDKTVLELKQAIAEKSDVEADRQRLIYSGRVLKDEDILSVYKIQTNHTIHMVKGAARTAGSSQPAATQPLPNMQAGQNPHDPLTTLNSHLGFGAMAGLNPFAEMGLNANDPNMAQTMMNSPDFLQQMSALMSNPAVMDQIIASNPQLSAMGPQVRELFQSEHFRQMMSDPQRLQQMFRLASLFQGAGGPFGGGAFGVPPASFPAPGVPGSTPAQAPSPTPAVGNTGTQPGAQPNPLFDPAIMQQILSMGPFGGGGGAGGAGLFGPPNPTPADTRPPEERFQVQLQQLSDMGFTNASQNIRALLATGGNVHTAIEYILNGGGL